MTGRPTISVGSVGLGGGDFLEQLRGSSTEAPIGTLDELVARMRSEEFDLIAVGRALISDPDWPVKIRDGRWSELQPFYKEELERLE
jgi:2,4-dienoyl-CoA reductase-like NADH-dependent reductase (Old Yellow Enzyme family)